MNASPRRALPQVACPRGAFTLIELLLVIALMSVLAGVLLPQMTPSNVMQLEMVAEIVASDVAYCRSLAVTYNSQYRLEFSVANNQYVLEHAGVNTTLDALPASITRSASDPPDQQITRLSELPRTGVAVELLFVETLSSPARLVTELEFGPLGETTETAETRIWLACGQGAERLYQAIRVNPVTGLTWIDAPQTTRPVNVAQTK